MQTVSIVGLEVFAYHGVTPEEKEGGQKFLLDLELELDRDRGAPDDVASTVDYAEVASGVAGVATRERFDLIETLAERVLDYLLSYDRVARATVSVFKPHAPMPVTVERVGVRVTRERDDSAGGERPTGG